MVHEGVDPCVLVEDLKDDQVEARCAAFHLEDLVAAASGGEVEVAPNVVVRGL